MKKLAFFLLKIIGVLALILVIAIIGFFLFAKYKGANYYKFTKPTGVVETKYTALGKEQVAYKEFEIKASSMKKVAIWYPENLAKKKQSYPIVIFANGTGSNSSTYQPFLKHLASWGFVVVGNDDENTRSGQSLNDTIDFLSRQNKNEESIFYQKLAMTRIGLAGHSQGGVGVFNMASKPSNQSKIQAIYAVSPTSSYHTSVFKDGWQYDVSQITVPTFIAAGTGTFDAGTAYRKEMQPDEKAGIMQGIAPLWSLEENFANLPNTIDKIIARKKGVDHGDSYLQFDGYMVAWFRYYLMNDLTAAQAFYGQNPEILHNASYQDVKIHSVIK